MAAADEVGDGVRRDVFGWCMAPLSSHVYFIQKRDDKEKRFEL